MVEWRVLLPDHLVEPAVRTRQHNLEPLELVHELASVGWHRQACKLGKVVALAPQEPRRQRRKARGRPVVSAHAGGAPRLR